MDENNRTDSGEEPGSVPDRRSDGGAKRRWRQVAAFAAVLAIGFVSTIVLADWLASGTGTGSARARVAAALETETASASETLYPGGTGDLAVRVKNPNPYPVTVNSVSQNGAITSDLAGCDATNHGVSLIDQTGLALAVPASASKTFTLTDAVAMASTSANECQGATFTIPVSLNGGTAGTGGGDGGGGEIPNCDDGDPGTDDTFNETTESCEHTYPQAGTVCDDGNDGTINDEHDGTGVCAGQPGTTFYRDADNDGWGTSDEIAADSSAPPGFVAVQGDCDDTNSSVNPGAIEIANGNDDDCDGMVDED